MFKPQNLLRTTITANLFKVKTEKFNLKGIAKVVAREKAKNAVYSIVENTVLQKKDKKKEKQELQKQQEQIKQHDAKVTQFAKENNLTHLSHEEQRNKYWESRGKEANWENIVDRQNKKDKNVNSMLSETITIQPDHSNLNKGTNATTQ
ncbi:hypothetical protein [Mycoplasmopsis bovis]|uniref:Uncharacterized protein n=3 Tax=Mycoplasmopsis bovis TaxID=28903 RepID=A0A2N8U2R4_MYCBV|nr:hypothetical protein [Mycoplasmopsis bovis]AXJ70891.1 hypothetical protein CH320_02765 [Mycoplasmopsis bovis]AXJ71088.1 hypothetical protein CH320_03945 [Mycoplasmopsis bovis]AXJ71744.1 hypothetical protein CH316_02860 [Mycoplasmopsis bovis]AXJ71942.1 hypothetical protein CH316_04030 [Mycoplasmopsis bovis]AXJ72095.1 hypothetical protein CH316_02115 [Mycoplasmopsis bovis]